MSSLYKDNPTLSTIDGSSGRRIHDMAEVRQFTDQEMRHKKILYRDTNNKQLLNVFRGLRTKLHKRARGRNYVCMVTSIVSGGGATYIANNLAAAIALDKLKSAMILDCNIYSPSAHNLMTTDHQNGLTDFLSTENLRVEEIVYATGIPRVRAIPVGDNRDGGAELFSNKRMRIFLEEVRNRYDDRFIIIDAPPIMDFPAEAQILSDLSDFTLVVVPSGKVTDQQVRSVMSGIAPEKLAGPVFNNI